MAAITTHHQLPRPQWGLPQTPPHGYGYARDIHGMVMLKIGVRGLVVVARRAAECV